MFLPRKLLPLRHKRGKKIKTSAATRFCFPLRLIMGNLRYLKTWIEWIRTSNAATGRKKTFYSLVGGAASLVTTLAAIRGKIGKLQDRTVGRTFRRIQGALYPLGIKLGSVRSRQVLLPTYQGMCVCREKGTRNGGDRSPLVPHA